jgi:hypothetical protein
MSDIKKVVRDGKVAVLYSPGYGAGWYSWNTHCPECLFDPAVVKMVEDGEGYETIRRYAEEHYEKENRHFYAGGAKNLTIEWVPEGTLFRVDEYDGSEHIETIADTDWKVA